MTFPAPFVSREMGIEPEWIDYNGHFNMAYYGVLFDRAADEIFALAGLGPDYVKATNNSFFTLECHTSYLRELAPSDRVTIDVQFLDHDHKRVHYVQQMRHASEGWISCVLEVIVSHVDLSTHKTSNFPPEVLAKIAGLYNAHKGLPVPPQVGHKIGIPRKA
ncbi:MAG: thioesterase family protein [Hyphomicrobiales bacterium]